MDSFIDFLMDVIHFINYNVYFSERTVVICFFFLFTIDMIGLVYAQIREKTHIKYFQAHLENGLLKSNLFKAGAIILSCIAYERYGLFNLFVYFLFLLNFWFQLLRQTDQTSRNA